MLFLFVFIETAFLTAPKFCVGPNMTPKWGGVVWQARIKQFGSKKKVGLIYIRELESY